MVRRRSLRVRVTSSLIIVPPDPQIGAGLFFYKIYPVLSKYQSKKYLTPSYPYPTSGTKTFLLLKKSCWLPCNKPKKEFNSTKNLFILNSRLAHFGYLNVSIGYKYVNQLEIKKTHDLPKQTEGLIVKVQRAR